jgi:hypothetical protein
VEVEIQKIPEKRESKFSAAVQSLSFDNVDYSDPQAILQTL